MYCPNKAHLSVTTVCTIIVVNDIILMLGIIFEKNRNTKVCPDEKTLFEGDYFLITICKDLRPPNVVCRDSKLQLLLFCEKHLYFF